ncbi:hypothetical protein HPP92_004349 [Vanilla planifolia]|uniref:UDP-glycosyltransferase n=1 Tax=Vanilla planifolia TaxID=51239 RepID=A0A835RJB9_VANPL|nr:hypothetical protein HPP92_004349 [Vanilla planifolia]
MLAADEMQELAFGLRNSGRPFIWVMRDNLREQLPEGFEKEIAREGRGLLVEWSPQEMVLAHPAISCFWGDQIPDAKFLCDVYGVGVRLPSPPSRADVERCLALATDGPQADAMRRRAEEWRNVALASVAPGGSSNRNIERFVDEIRKWVANGGASAHAEALDCGIPVRA